MGERTDKHFQKFSDELCNNSARRFSYDFATRTGHLWFGFGCGDMTGTIQFFYRIDPQVKIIQTHWGEKIDTRYVRDGLRWLALSYERKQPQVRKRRAA